MTGNRTLLDFVLAHSHLYYSFSNDEYEPDTVVMEDVNLVVFHNISCSGALNSEWNIEGQ